MKGVSRDCAALIRWSCAALIRWSCAALVPVGLKPAARAPKAGERPGRCPRQWIARIAGFGDGAAGFSPTGTKAAENQRTEAAENQRTKAAVHQRTKAAVHQRTGASEHQRS